MLSGDCIIVRGQPKGGPPPEQQIALSNVVAPKVGRRANPNVEGSLETRDEVMPIPSVRINQDFNNREASRTKLLFIEKLEHLILLITLLYAAVCWYSAFAKQETRCYMC